MSLKVVYQKSPLLLENSQYPPRMRCWGLPTSFIKGSIWGFLQAPTSLWLSKYSSLGQKSVSEITSLNSECWQGCFSSGSFRGDSISLPFPNFSRQLHFLRWKSPFSIFKANSASPWTFFSAPSDSKVLLFSVLHLMKGIVEIKW